MADPEATILPQRPPVKPAAARLPRLKIANEPKIHVTLFGSVKPELQQAVDLLRSRDSAAVERALALLQGTVFSFSMKVCGHREDAEDTSQDVLLRALPYLSKFDSPEALAVWLYKVARNRCVSARRHSKFAPAAHLSLDELMPDGRDLQELIASPESSAEQSLLTAEGGERLRRAVLKMPPAYRLVLVLHDMEELDTAEVAGILGIREGTVRVRLHRARLFLRKELRRKPGAAASRKPVARGRNCRGMFASLSDYLDGIVDDATCEQMQTHIADCPPCQAFVESLRRAVEACRAYTPECKRQQTQFRQELLRQYLRAAEALKRGTSRKRARRT